MFGTRNRRRGRRRRVMMCGQEMTSHHGNLKSRSRDILQDYCREKPSPRCYQSPSNRKLFWNISSLVLHYNKATGCPGICVTSPYVKPEEAHYADQYIGQFS